MKIFQDKGRDRAKVDLEYGGKLHISGVAGRTIKPDGRIVEMKKDAIFDRDAVKGKGLRIKTVSFTLPDVQAGDIIEYQWKEVETGVLSNYLRLPLQRDIPAQAVRYFVKPFSSQYLNLAMSSRTFHAPQKAFQKAPLGYFLLEYANMPAWKEEPDSPPENETRAWTLVFYTEGEVRTPEKYWPDQGRKLYASFKQDTKVTGEMKKLAGELISGAPTDDAKIKALYTWVHKNVKNVNAAGSTAEDRAAFKENKGSADTFKKRIGTGYDINILFASLVSAAGFDARMAMTGDRGRLFFDPTLADTYFLGGEAVAVKLGGKWKFYDPATPFLGSGDLIWEQQGTPALVTDGKTPEWVNVNLSAAGASRENHVAHISLGADGSMSGAFEISYTGHLAEEERWALLRKSKAEREQYLTDQMKRQFNTPEVSDVAWEAVEDPEVPLKVTFKMKVPVYVQRTGKRIFFQPAVLQFGQGARFTASERKFPVYIHFPWSETDTVTIDIPEGFEFDHPDLPAPFVAGQTCNWKATAMINGGRQLVYKREFQFGTDGTVLVVPQNYGALKRIFDTAHQNDEYALALKQTVAK